MRPEERACSMNFQRDEWLLSKQRWETKTCPNSAHGSAIPHDLMHLVTSIPQSRVFSFRCWHLFKVSKTPCSNPLNSYSLPIFSSILCPRQSSHHRCNNICIEKRQTSKSTVAAAAAIQQSKQSNCVGVL